ncbi:methyltransferase-like protein 25B [Styela clava]
MQINSDSILAVKRHLEALLRITNYYQNFTDTYVVEFFVEDLWSRVPHKWREVLDEMTSWEFAEEIFQPTLNSVYSRVYPLSLLSFKACCNKLQIPRQVDGLDNSTTSRQQLSKLFNYAMKKHINMKKQHELKQLCEVIVNEAAKSGSSHVVDVGSGRGHLSRLLSIEHNFKVTSIESDDKNVERARVFDKECLEFVSKTDSNAIKILPTHITHHVKRYISGDEFVTLIKTDSSINNDRILLSGLHACGDLSPTMIYTFVNCKEIACLISVACCYMKLSVDELGTQKAEPHYSVEGDKLGYPMSKYVASIQNHQIKFTSRKISCHSNEALSEKMLSDGGHLKVQCYRAVLEYILRKKNPNMIRPGVHNNNKKSTKKTCLSKFADYLVLAFNKLDIPVPTNEEFDNIHIKQMLSKNHRVVIFYALCSMLAPLIENIILLDRAVYLYENGFDSSVQCIFEPKISPRCFALFASKS